MTSVDRMHAYSQWPNVGSVWQKSKFSRGTEFGCKASLIWDAWQQRKLSVATARREILHNRDRVEAALRQLDTHNEMVQSELMLDRHLLEVKGRGGAVVALQGHP